MRITGGKSKGRQLANLKGLKIRPTSDKVREAIFNLLGQDMSDVNVLDLFSGTGCLGIEALSRGASGAVFIDNSLQAIKLIKKNIDLCRFKEKGIIIKMDLRKGLPLNHERLKIGFGLIFLDPPYGKELIPPVLKNIDETGIADSQAIIVAETAKSDMLPELEGNISLINIKIYGETKIHLYRNRKDQ